MFFVFQLQRALQHFDRILDRMSERFDAEDPPVVAAPRKEAKIKRRHQFFRRCVFEHERKETANRTDFAR